MIVVWESDISGPVQTSCYCRAELNSGIKFDKSTAEARRLNQTFSDTFLIPRLNCPIEVTGPAITKASFQVISFSLGSESFHQDFLSYNH